MGFRAADACADEGGGVSAPGVLAQHGRGMPQAGDGVARHRKGTHAGAAKSLDRSLHQDGPDDEFLDEAERPYAGRYKRAPNLSACTRFPAQPR